MTRASYNNQARLHNGYHYPRTFSTAFRSHYNFARFFQDYRPAIATDFIKLYAIARIGSKVSPRQFELFCQSIEAPLRPASTGRRKETDHIGGRINNQVKTSFGGYQELRV